jgi:glutathione S-transferase
MILSCIFLPFFSAEGGMTLYCKAGPDGKSVGDCPFAHFVRLVLEEKGLDYDLRPAVQETKPTWLIEHYDGKMPALRHRQECYVESDVIAAYLDFFFPDPPLAVPPEKEEAVATAVEGFFPAVARYLKHALDGDDADQELKQNLCIVLERLDKHLSSSGPFLAGEKMTLADCSLAPKLYHLQTGLAAFKDGAVDVPKDYPRVQAYCDTVFARPSFQKTVYPAETVAWGWGNARQAPSAR